MKGKNIMKIAAFLLQLFSLLIIADAQEKTGNKYPPGYFRNPLGIPLSVTGNFGELRPNHWHMGLDLRTNQKENQPVYAAANGYIAHVGIRSQSFGRYIIINHPNGLSTLYAHLNKFFPELEEYVEQQQQKKESWAIELDFTETQFPVKQGKFIAFSGNTGGSQGPHLHFEIRDTKTDRSLNPLLFGFAIKDDIPPVITRLGIYDRDFSTYEQNPKLIPLKKTDSGFYTLPRKIITGYKKISFAIGAYDRLTGASTPDGIYSAFFYFDEKPQGGFILDNINYYESVYVNAQIDYRFKFNGGSNLQHLSKLPGDYGNVYQEIESEYGIIELSDTAEHLVRIEVSDAYDNLSELFFTIQYNESLSQQDRKDQQKQFVPGYVNLLEEKDFEIYIPETCLYDTVNSFYSRNDFSIPNAVTAMHQVNDPSIPVHDNFTVRIKPTVAIAADQRNKIVLVREWRGRRSIQKAIWHKEWLTGSFSDFGNFRAFIDLIPPVLNAPGKGKDTLNLSALNRIVFTPTDNYGIKSFRAELNGQWLKFTNDKARSFIYIFDEQCPYGVHELKVRVEDIVGNVTEKTWWFKRHPYTPPKKKVVKKKRKKK